MRDAILSKGRAVGYNDCFYGYTTPNPYPVDSVFYQWWDDGYMLGVLDVYEDITANDN